MDPITVTDTTTRTATGLLSTTRTFLELTRDHRITVGHTTNIREATRGVPTIRVPTRREIGETTITEVARGIIYLKVGTTTRTANGIAIPLCVMEIQLPLRSLVLPMKVKDTKKNEA